MKQNESLYPYLTYFSPYLTIHLSMPSAPSVDLQGGFWGNPLTVQREKACETSNIDKLLYTLFIQLQLV